MPVSVSGSGVSPILTIDYDRTIEEQIVYDFTLLQYIERKGFNRQTGSTVVKWGINTGSLPTARTYASIPSSFSDLTGTPSWLTASLGLKHVYTPVRLDGDLKFLASKTGALTDVGAATLEQIGTVTAKHLEWQLCGGDTSGVMFLVNGTPSTTTVNIDSYCGRSGESIGTILDSLALTGYAFNANASSGAAGRSPANAIPRVVSWVSTPGSESITFDQDVQAQGWANNDRIYLSRSDVANGGQTDGDALQGVVLACDDFTDAATFQTLTAATAPLFSAKVFRNSGILRDLGEAELQRAYTAMKIRGGRVNQAGQVLPDVAFLANTATVDKLRITAVGDRRWNDPMPRKLIKPAFGVDPIEAVTFANVPFIQADLALRNRVLGFPVGQVGFSYAGNMSGQWVDDGSPTDRHRVSGSNQFEMVRMLICELMVRTRNHSSQIQDVNTMSGL